ncbi:trp operon leader peptide [Escherichia coli]|nr:trp operon leader peptide [Escherichia coli]NZB26979.1 trp operon leader peptide [Escherichia coli]
MKALFVLKGWWRTS